MVEFWSALSGAEHFFYFIALFSSGMMLLFLLLNLIGLVGGEFELDGPDGDVGGIHLEVGGGDMDVGDMEHPGGLGFISLRTLLAFGVGFGWGGAAALEGQQALYMAVIVALVAGQIFMFIVFWLMSMLNSLAETGTVNPKAAKGKKGSVYVPIPPQGEGRGQVQVVVQGRLREYGAISEEKENLATGTPIEVVRVLDDHTMVVKQSPA